MTSSRQSIAFIGGGNMARALIGGMVGQSIDPSSIHVAEPVAASREALEKDFGVCVHGDAVHAAVDRQTWVLAVKPQVMQKVCRSLAELADWQHPLVISIAAGITSNQIQEWLGVESLPVVRVMPNTPALLGAGATGMFATDKVNAESRKEAQSLLSSTGLTLWIANEDLMDAVTALSGSGPAYVFLLAEAMQAAAEAQGLDADTARALAAQTVLGAARMLTESGEEAAELRRRVTSPNGTTHAAIQSFEGDGFRAMVDRAINAATERGRSLSAEFGGDAGDEA